MESTYLEAMFTLRVPFFDTDAMGIVHHANYLRYFEMARVEFLREKGLDYKVWQEKGLHLPLVESQCRYKKPARFDDILNIAVTLNTDGVRANLNYEITLKETGDLLATGFTQHVCVDNKMRVLPLPSELKSLA
jgi:acyl-CoA thioester hydrolase